MTYFCSFVIANPVCWLRQGVKRSPARGTRTGSIPSYTREGQLRNPPTKHASLPMTYLVLIVIANPAGWLQQGVKRSPTRGTRTGSIRSHTRRGQLRNPPTNYASLPMTTLFSSSLRTQGWFVGKAVKQSPAREAAATATSMRYIYWRGWLRSPCTSIASLPMTYFCFFVIANLVGWPQRCVKRSPTRGTRTGSIPSHTRGGAAS